MIFDTTALISAIRRGRAFEEGSISIITLIEVLRGIEDEEKRKETANLLEEAFEILDVNRDVAEAYNELYFELKKKGKVSPDADQLIAATARSRSEALLTSDKDFLEFEPLVKVKFIAPN